MTFIFVAVGGSRTGASANMIGVASAVCVGCDIDATDGETADSPAPAGAILRLTSAACIGCGCVATGSEIADAIAPVDAILNLLLVVCIDCSTAAAGGETSNSEAPIDAILKLILRVRVVGTVCPRELTGRSEICQNFRRYRSEFIAHNTYDRISI